MAEPVWGRGLVADLISQGCQGSKACTEQGLVHCFPLAPLSLEDKTCELWELWMQCWAVWCEVGGPWVLGVCPARHGAVVLLGLLSGRQQGGKEGRSTGGSVLFFTPCSSPCRVPGAWTGPHQHSCGHRGPAPTSQHQLLWQQTEVRVPCHVSITGGLLWLCLDCPCAVHPTPDLPVSPWHAAHRRSGAGVVCAGGQQSWQCRGVTVQPG